MPKTITDSDVLLFEEKDKLSANTTFAVFGSGELGNSGSSQGIAKLDAYKGEVFRGDLGSMNNLHSGDDTIVGENAKGEKVPSFNQNLITRAVASSRLDEALGMGVTASESYGKLTNPETGQEMIVGVSAMVDGQAILGWNDERTAQVQSNINFENPTTQRGLSDLQVMHCLTNQVDAHGGNIFVNAAGEVKGIDNDLSWGTKNRGELDGEAQKKTPVNLPTHIHTDTARKVEGLSEDQLRKILKSVDSPEGGHKLSRNEVDAAVERLQNVKEQILLARVEGRVVNEFNQDTFKAAVDHEKVARSHQKFGDACGSYLGREHLELQVAIGRDGEGPFIAGSAPQANEPTEMAKVTAKIDNARAEVRGPDSPFSSIRELNQKSERLNEKLEVNEARLTYKFNQTINSDAGKRYVAAKQALEQQAGQLPLQAAMNHRGPGFNQDYVDGIKGMKATIDEYKAAKSEMLAEYRQSARREIREHEKLSEKLGKNEAKIERAVDKKMKPILAGYSQEMAKAADLDRDNYVRKKNQELNELNDLNKLDAIANGPVESAPSIKDVLNGEAVVVDGEAVAVESQDIENAVESDVAVDENNIAARLQNERQEAPNEPRVGAKAGVNPR